MTLRDEFRDYAQVWIEGHDPDEFADAMMRIVCRTEDVRVRERDSDPGEQLIGTYLTSGLWSIDGVTVDVKQDGFYEKVDGAWRRSSEEGLSKRS